MGASNLVVARRVRLQAVLPANHAVLATVEGGAADGGSGSRDAVIGLAFAAVVEIDDGPAEGALAGRGVFDSILEQRCGGHQDRVRLKGPNGRAEGDELHNEVRPMQGDPAGQDTAQAVADHAHGPSRFAADVIYCVFQSLCRLVDAAGVEADAGEEWVIADPLEPEVHLHHVEVSGHETWDEDDGAAVAAGYAETKVHGRKAQREPVDRPQHLPPDERSLWAVMGRSGAPARTGVGARPGSDHVTGIDPPQQETRASRETLRLCKGRMAAVGAQRAMQRLGRSNGS